MHAGALTFATLNPMQKQISDLDHRGTSVAGRADSVAGRRSHLRVRAVGLLQRFPVSQSSPHLAAVPFGARSLFLYATG
jgi:hypothetical protein